MSNTPLMIADHDEILKDVVQQINQTQREGDAYLAEMKKQVIAELDRYSDQVTDLYVKATARLRELGRLPEGFELNKTHILAIKDGTFFCRPYADQQKKDKTLDRLLEMILDQVTKNPTN